MTADLEHDVILTSSADEATLKETFLDLLSVF